MVSWSVGATVGVARSVGTVDLRSPSRPCWVPWRHRHPVPGGVTYPASRWDAEASSVYAIGTIAAAAFAALLYKVVTGDR
jgi:hypothetical protein